MFSIITTSIQLQILVGYRVIELELIGSVLEQDRQDLLHRLRSAPLPSDLSAPFSRSASLCVINKNTNKVQHITRQKWLQLPHTIRFTQINGTPHRGNSMRILGFIKNLSNRTYADAGRTANRQRIQYNDRKNATGNGLRKLGSALFVCILAFILIQSIWYRYLFTHSMCGLGVVGNCIYQ